MDIQTSLSVISFLLLLLLPLLFLLKNKSTKKLPPGPPGLPIIGNLHQLGVSPHASLSQLSKKYGPVMLLHLRYVQTVIISSAEAAKEVLKTHDIHTCSRPLSTGTGRLFYNYRDIAFTPYGDYHREMRKLCVLELFGVRKVQSFRFIREEEVALLIECIEKFSSSSTSVDLSEITMSLSANITFREAFGKSFRERGIGGRNLPDIVHDAFAMLGSFSAADFYPYFGWIIDRFTGFHSRLERSFHELDSFFQQVVDDHLQAEKTEHGHEDVVDVLLRLARSGFGSRTLQITQDQIKGILMDIFLAGVETTAITLVWAMAELVRNPRIMKKAQEEIRAFVGDAGKVSESNLDHFTYLRMIVKETLRLHPPGPLLIPRETMSDINLNGYHIDSKTRILINAWAIARDPETWENPLEFIPERFIDNPIDYKGRNYELIPFGSGRRTCPGMPLAIATVELSLANLLYSFDWKLPDGMKVEDINMDEVFVLSMYKKIPLVLVPVKYSHA